MKRYLLLFLIAVATPGFADMPLVNDRLVFNWHNFLSGCSTWNLADWNRWTDDAQKLGYNAIMVHAYGNNPMVSFTFNGKTKPVGYLSTTARGRDWATMHVNDVRRLFGGAVFDKPVFGADAAQGPEKDRAAGARKLMQGVFAHAGERGMNVFFADDVDTPSANPQELILSLPESARFARQTNAGKFWLVNPETAEGFAYYKAQVATLLEDYPQITCLVVWFREFGTPWMDLKLSEMPPAWQAEYNAAITRKPEAAKYWHAPNMFAIGKIARAFERALKELGRDRVRLAAGTWNFGFLPGADLFFPPSVAFIGLDYDVLHGNSALSTAERRQNLAEVGAHRALIPVIWAHHDDGTYIGRPFTPMSEFCTKLTEAKANGFGVIHWTTRPLELFFASHIRQVFEQTKDEPLRVTCEQVGGKELGEYLYRWVTEAPQFARETSDYFIDRPLTNTAAIVAGCRSRLALLDKATGEQAGYFRGLESFMAAFYETHGQFQDAEALWKKGDLAGAQAVMANCHPEPVIEQFARFSSIGGITRGEQGLVVSLNTRWLVYFVRLRQMLGMEPVRYNFAPTSHDELAQAPGHFTYHFDAGHRVWQTLGTEETRAEIFSAPSAEAEIARHGLETDKPLTLTLQPIVHKAALPSGQYRLRLLAADPTSTGAGQRVFDVEVKAGKAKGGLASAVTAVTEHVDLFAKAGVANRLVELVYPVNLPAPGAVEVRLVPVTGKAVISGAVLEPVNQ